MTQTRKSPAGMQGKSKARHPYDNSCRTQRARLIQWFETYHRLSTFEAREEGIVHPGARIMELRRQGYLIDTVRVTELDHNGVSHRIGLYLYKGKAMAVRDD